MAEDKSGSAEMHDEVNALKSDLGKLQEDLQKIAQSMMGRGRDSAREYRDMASKRMESGLEAVEQYIEQRPVSTVLAAFAIGLMAGKLFGGK